MKCSLLLQIYNIDKRRYTWNCITINKYYTLSCIVQTHEMYFSMYIILYLLVV